MHLAGIGQHMHVYQDIDITYTTFIHIMMISSSSSSPPPHRLGRVMSSSRALLLVLILCLYGSTLPTTTDAFIPTPTTTKGQKNTLTKLHDTKDNAETSPQKLKDYRNEASNLFGNVRIPAALFAGASAGAAFAMPIVGADNLRLGLVKRVYALLMMAALSSEILAVVISTLATSNIASRQDSTNMLTTNVSELLKNYYNLEWIATRYHFLNGVLMFIIGIGIRAWVTISCPIIAQGALGIIVSSTLLCLAFIQELQPVDILDGCLRLPIKYIQLLWNRAKQRPIFALALLMSIITNVYIISKIPHVVHYLGSPH